MRWTVLPHPSCKARRSSKALRYLEVGHSRWVCKTHQISLSLSPSLTVLCTHKEEVMWAQGEMVANSILCSTQLALQSCEWNSRNISTEIQGPCFEKQIHAALCKAFFSPSISSCLYSSLIIDLNLLYIEKNIPSPYCFKTASFMVPLPAWPFQSLGLGGSFLE